MSGSNKKKNFEVLDVLHDLSMKNNLNIDIGIAYNPYWKNYYNIGEERLRFEKKMSFGLTKSIWLQYGSDIKLLEAEINFLKKIISDNSSITDYKKVKFFGSLLIPSKQFISRFKFRPWKGVYISDKYLNSLNNFQEFTKDLIDFYHGNDIYPIIETDFCSIDKLKEIYGLLKI